MSKLDNSEEFDKLIQDLHLVEFDTTKQLSVVHFDWFKENNLNYNHNKSPLLVVNI